ncbi:GGDEF domain-containing protein, partial [bacterium]|nr:GGDEF domain-containing protein [bacterium]
MRNAESQSIGKEDNSRETLKTEIDLLEDKFIMEKEMRENLEYAMDEISDYLFSSLEELTTNAKQLKKRNIELEIQDKIVKIINQEINLENVLKTLLQQALYLFPHGDKGAFLQNDVQSNQFRFAAIEGYSAEAIESLSLSYKDVLTIMTKNVQQLDQGIFVINQFDIEATLQQNVFVKAPNSVIAIVLSLEKKLDDFLILDLMNDAKNFDQQDIKNLARFREHAISAISKAKILELLQEEKEKTEKALDITQQANKELETARKKLEEMSLTDTLTKLRNRRFLGTFIDCEIDKTLRKYYEWLQGHRSESPSKSDLVFYMLDIDYFKWVNDTFGHDSGDRVLEQVSDILKAECRGSDIVIRWGGE